VVGVGLDAELGVAVGAAVGTGEGVVPPAPGPPPIIAGMPPFVLQAETAAESAAAATSAKRDFSTRLMAQAGYLWSIRASPARGGIGVYAA